MSRFPLGIQKQTKTFKDQNGAVRIWRCNSAAWYIVVFKTPSGWRFYEYASLDRLPPDTIRLLNLQPDTSREGIQMRDLSRALGRSTQILRLVLHVGRLGRGRADKLSHNRFMIRKNLWNGLLHLRRHSTPMRFWIDAICIYQDRYQSKCCRNLRFEPQFYEGVGFTLLACRIRKFTLRVFIMKIY
jgi:hypothetical protein